MLAISQVTGYEPQTALWSVEWQEGTTKEKGTQRSLPRLRVYFKAEDPFNFADRIADAHARREVRAEKLRTHEITRKHAMESLEDCVG